MTVIEIIARNIRDHPESAKNIIKALEEAGYRIVPVEPTVEMQNAAVDKTEFHYTHPQQTGIRESPQLFFKSAYKAMLEASRPDADRAD